MGLTKTIIKNLTQQFFDEIGANIKIVGDSTGLNQPYSSVKLVNDPDDGTFGSTESSDFMNVEPSDQSKLMAQGFITAASLFYVTHPYAQFPFTHNEMAYLMAKVSVHETCHTLGLVSPGKSLTVILDGIILCPMV